MTDQAALSVVAVTTAIEAVMRKDRGRLIAALISRLRDFQLAEEALQEACISALSHWARSGLPASPQGWLLKVSLRKAIDRLRGVKREDRKAAEIAVLAVEEASDMTPESIPDERLRLIFTCCHPALDQKSRVALTLRTIGGLTTSQIAGAFLDTEPTMGQRLSRAKAKIAAARIPFAVPGPEAWPDRLNSVLTVFYLIYTVGYTQGPKAGYDLCTEAIFLARLLVTLAPDQAEVEGCLALLVLTQARAPARTSANGVTLSPSVQDRTLWDQAMLAEGDALLDRAIARRAPDPFQIKAAIAALHCAQRPDWPQIAALYTRLLDHEPTAVVRLNHAVAVAEAGRPDAALQALQALSGELSDYQPFHAALADLLSRTGRTAEARAAYAEAIARAASPADRAFLQARLDAL